MERLTHENSELREKHAILIEENDRMNDRLAALATGELPTEEEREEARNHIEGLRKELRAMTTKVDHAKSMYGSGLSESKELKQQCRSYRSVLQKMRREGRQIPAIKAPVEDDDPNWKSVLSAYPPHTKSAS